MYLALLIGSKPTTLIYNGTAHGWMIKDFRSRCLNKGPTIVLFKIKDGDCVGGYTAAKWTSDNQFVNDTDAVLFNLELERHFRNKGWGGELYSFDRYGPCFGPSELVAFWEPFNGNKSCASHVNNGKYSIPKVGGKNMLTNLEDMEFTITELEVWEVKK